MKKYPKIEDDLKTNLGEGISLATLARRESKKSVTQIVSITIIIIIPIFIFFKLNLYVKELEQIQKGIWSSISYSISINDTYQIERTLHKLKEEFSLETLHAYEVNDAGEIIKHWGKEIDPNGGIRALEEINNDENNKLKKIQIVDNWFWDIVGKVPSLNLVMNYEVGSDRKIQISIIKKLPIISFFIELAALFLIIIAGQLFLVSIFLRLTKNLVGPIETLTNLLRFTDSDALSKIPKITEVQQLFLKLREHENIVKSSMLELQEKEKNKAIINLSKQVAHDIRSPLAALDIIIKHSEVSTDDRKMLDAVVERIKGILNDLTSETILKKENIVNIVQMIEEIFKEKRAEYLLNPSVDITYVPTRHPVFLDIDEVGFKRCISNLINNSVEASGTVKNKINILMNFKDNFLEISISDTGKGIENESFKEILDKGISFNKPGGSGIGIKACKEYLQKYSGTIEYSPNHPNGIVATIKLPFGLNIIKEGSISVTPETEVIVIDDEEMAPEIWRKKMSGLPNNLRCFKNYHAIDALDQNSRYLFLCDYDLGIGQMNGLEIKQRLAKTKLDYDFILVSGAGNENFSTEIGLNLIPKTFLPNIRFVNS